MKKGEAWLIGMNIQPLNEVNQIVDPNITRKLLLTKSELSKIFKSTQEKGLTCIPTKLFWKEKAAFVTQLNKWSLKKINIALINLSSSTTLLSAPGTG